MDGSSLAAEAFVWLLDAVPDGLVLTTLAEGRIAWANEAYARLTGIPLREMLGRTTIELGTTDPESRRRWVQEVAARPVLYGEGMLNTMAGERPVRAVSRIVEIDGERYVAVALRDVSDTRLAARALRRRSAILEAVSFAADRFLQASWRDEIDEALRRLGEAAEVSRVYVFEIVDHGEHRARVLRHEWAAPGVPAASSFPHHLGAEDSAALPGGESALSRGEAFAALVADLPEPERSHFAAEGVRSIVAAPILTGERWWGLIGFDHCTEDRRWEHEEIEALTAAARILGASIHHAFEETNVKDAEARYRTLVEQIPAVVYIDAVEGPSTTLYISPQTEPMLGLTQHDWMTDAALLSKHIHPEDRPRWRERVQRSDASGEPFELEYRIVAADGRVVWVHDESVLVQDADGAPRFWHGVMFDITERKAAESTLREALDREREAAARLRTLDEMKTTFLQAVSHELRTPLTSILGSALTLENSELDLPPEDARDLVVRIASNARKLHRLLGDLLDLDRLARGIVEPNRQPTDVRALVLAVMKESDVVAGRAVHAEVAPVMADVDAAKVERIFENLLANAARHTPEGTPIWVRVASEDGGVMLCVEDAGPGVPEAEREAIFEPFRQAGHPTPYAPGVGVGLALVARFAELHGGRAWVEERSGGGASFRVSLPGTAPAGVGSEEA